MSDADADMVSNKDDMLADTPTIPKEDELASIPKEDELASSAPADAQALMDATADNDEGLKKHGKVGSDSDTDGPPPEGRRGARRTGFGTEPGPTGREEASRPATALTPQELLDKVARAKSFARHQLFELTRQHREAEMRLRQLDAGARVRASDERELNQTGSKRGRDDPLSPEGGEHARKERRHSESAKEESRDGDGGSAHKEGGSARPSDRASKVAADSDAEGRERGGDGGNVAMRVDVAEAVGAPSDGATPGSAGADRPGRRPPPPPPLRMSPSPRVHQDEGAQKRNRKMFGVLLGTLQRAKAETASSKTAAIRQQKLEKVESKLKSDREKLIEHQRSFLVERRAAELSKRDAIRAQRAAMDGRLLRLTWDGHELALSAFLRTETGPPIYYMPKKHNDATRARLRDQQSHVRKHLAESPIMLADPLALPDATGEANGAAGGPAPMAESAPAALETHAEQRRDVESDNEAKSAGAGDEAADGKEDKEGAEASAMRAAPDADDSIAVDGPGMEEPLGHLS